MKIKDLIAELQRFPADSNIAVEVTSAQTRMFNECDNAIYFDLATVEPENTERHSLKLTLE